MASELVEISKAVTDDINSNVSTFSVDFEEANRFYAGSLDEELKDLEVLHVDVVPVGYATSELDDRNHWLFRCSADIGVRKRFRYSERDQNTGRILSADADCLVDLVQEIFEFFSPRTLSNYTQANWHECVIRAAYSKRDIRQHGQFTGIVRVTYDVTKENV